MHNLKNVSVEIPRDKLIVVTGLSGSGKSSLAFDTIYAEGQRRYMESLSSFAKRFVSQVAKPDVDFVFGLSPVISIEQKTIGSNPRSTVGTMTDIASYLNLLFATIGEPHCPRTGEPTPSRTASQILEAILALPNGAEIELRAPVFKVYGEDLDFVFTEIRKKGCRKLIIDGKTGRHLRAGGARRSEGEAHGRDRRPRSSSVAAHEKAIKAGIAATLLVGDGLMQIQIVKGVSKAETRAVLQGAHEPDAPFRVRRHPARLLHVQQPRERVPHVRRSRGAQAHASRAAPARSDAQHPRRLLRARRRYRYNPETLGRRADVQPEQGVRLLARHAVAEAAAEGARSDPERDRGEDRDDVAARGEGEPREVGRAADGLRRHRAAHRAALPPLSTARRGELEHGGVARQGDGRAHVPRLQRRAPPRDAAHVHDRRQDDLTTSASCTSTSCTRSSAR